MNRIFSGIARSAVATLAMTILLGVPHRAQAADELEAIHAANGQRWYEHYCTPCHGMGGAPGSAVYAGTKTPVDLRAYVARNGGKFPAARWISVVTTENPALSHTEVWQRIRREQPQGGPVSVDLSGRAVVASIASYVRSVQQP